MDDYGKKEGNWKMIHKEGEKFCNVSKRWKKPEREFKKKKKDMTVPFARARAKLGGSIC